MPHVLGLTGNIASGKTTVGLMLLELGANVYVDADTVVHELYLPGAALPAQLAQAFGPEILDSEGGVDRRKLGEIVFGDTVKLRQLEAIVHPTVREALIARMRSLGPDEIGVLDAIKLIESGYTVACQGVWIVTCPEAIQFQRLVETRGLKEEEARARLAAQPPIAEKLSQATAVIHNDGSLDDLRRQVTEAWVKFKASLPE
jgi:dephospho-CoA kinase